MKKIFVTIAAGLIASCLNAQAPQKVSYQAVIRNSSDQLITNQQVGMKISIFQGMPDGTADYIETHTPTTNANGLVSIEIGGGSVISGNFSSISWDSGPYFLKTETAIAPPLTTYTITGSSEILSVPFALYANKSLSSHGAVTVWDVDQTIAGNKTFTGTITVPAPVNSADAATKVYVDSKAPVHYVGEFYGGGIVFWVDGSGQHGLVCAKNDQSAGVRWYAGTYTNTMARGDGPLSGEMNTAIIIANQGNGDGNTYAARICNELQITEGGKTYGDWYLPSLGELTLIYENRTLISATAISNGGSSVSEGDYWSSTEKDNGTAWAWYFNMDFFEADPKLDVFQIRAVRSF